jgi:hypothetical protein
VPILLVQANNRAASGIQASAVVDYIIGNSKALATPGLRRKHAARLFDGLRVTRQQAAHLCLLVAIDSQHAIDELTQWRTGQQWYDDDLVGAFRGFGLAPGLEADARVQNCLECESGRVVGKHKLAHGRAIESTIAVDNVVPKVLTNLLERGLAGFYDLACDDVGVDDGHPEFGKHVGDRGLAAGDATGQPDPQRPV